ncbi:MAG TPA: DUF2164 domain-containing protein [Vicinamibacterales bacterium]|jgi:uncharacterized protein (DUF2164 family)
MARQRAQSTRLVLSDERRTDLVATIQHFVSTEFDHELSEFQARSLLDFFIRHLGAPVYNQAVQDVRAFLQEKVSDLDVEFYEPEEPHR